MFGMGFGELAVVVIVGLLIFGPKELPKVLKKLGQWAGKLRRMAADLRAQSGIDEALMSEGLTEPIREIQKLTRGELDGVVRAARGAPAILPPPSGGPVAAYPNDVVPEAPEVDVPRDREVPTIGCDAYGALPDDAVIYRETLPQAALASDPLWTTGEEPPPKSDARAAEAAKVA